VSDSGFADALYDVNLGLRWDYFGIKKWCCRLDMSDPKGHKLWDFRDINQPSQAQITA
jgi:hypothetical protein